MVHQFAPPKNDCIKTLPHTAPKFGPPKYLKQMEKPMETHGETYEFQGPLQVPQVFRYLCRSSLHAAPKDGC